MTFVTGTKIATEKRMERPRARILVVEDDEGIARALRRGLAFEGYTVEVAPDGVAALDALRSANPPEVVVLDIMLPVVDGLEVLRRLREAERTTGAPPTPVILLTARDTVDDRVGGLDAGADDYLVKPFALDELLARIRALLRRTVSTAATESHRNLTFGDLRVDLEARQAWRGDREVRLTPRAWDLLVLLLRHPNQVLTREQIMHRVWGDDFFGDPNVLEVYVGQLRKELEGEGEPRLIQTVRGVGYVLRQS